MNEKSELANKCMGMNEVLKSGPGELAKPKTMHVIRMQPTGRGATESIPVFIFHLGKHMIFATLIFTAY